MEQEIWAFLSGTGYTLWVNINLTPFPRPLLFSFLSEKFKNSFKGFAHAHAHEHSVHVQEKKRVFVKLVIKENLHKYIQKQISQPFPSKKKMAHAHHCNEKLAFQTFKEVLKIKSLFARHQTWQILARCFIYVQIKASWMTYSYYNLI